MLAKDRHAELGEWAHELFSNDSVDLPVADWESLQLGILLIKQFSHERPVLYSDIRYYMLRGVYQSETGHSFLIHNDF